MDEKSLYETLLGLREPWAVERVEVHSGAGEVHVWVALPGKTRWVCPECLEAAPIHDHQERVWRHLDTCQFKTLIHARVPRLTCPTHGIKQLPVPWAEPGARFTALFEALAIDWLLRASVTAVAAQLRLSWDEAAGIQARAVRRGLARREAQLPAHLGVDETAYQKRHEYVTVVLDRVAGTVAHVADDRRRESLETFLSAHPAAARAAVETVAMDMWAPYIAAVVAQIPGAAEKICFDKFHVAQHLGEAVDRVRRAEQRELRAAGDTRLTGTKYLWLTHPAHLSETRWAAFGALRRSALRTARAWAIKELAMTLWRYQSRGWARRAWQRWLGWALRCRLEPVQRVARMVRTFLGGILNAIVHGVTNARSEGVNAKIQWIKYTARGFRNRERFRNAIYFHCGGLDLYPAFVSR
jgi:transposase